MYYQLQRIVIPGENTEFQQKVIIVSMGVQTISRKEQTQSLDGYTMYQ